ncbi:MAG: EboA domain-containing protein [Solirubrobacterales bacterium]
MNPIEPDSLERALAERLDAHADGHAGAGRGDDAERDHVSAAERLAAARSDVAADPSRIAVVFPGVGRMVGRAMLTADADPDDPHAWTVADAARTLLLVSVGDAVDAEIQALYRHGDGEERRGVLRALPFLAIDRGIGVALVEDALRTNDVRLIAAACGPYAAAEIDDDAIAHATLKCVFVGVPLGGFVGLEGRLTPEIAAMLARFAHERVAAGRDVPDDIWAIVNDFPATAEVTEIEAELDHPDEGRAAAARRALDRRALLGATPKLRS